jgi:hypothetical protein
MAGKQSNERQLVAELAILLGANEGMSPDAVTRDSLARLTQKDLVSASKKLGLVAVSKLKKDDLVVQVWGAWTALLQASKGNGHSGGAASAPIPKVVVTPAGSPGGAPTPEKDEATAEVAPHSHKFELGEAGREVSKQATQASQAVAREIPWGYGRDRITAMAIDPDRFFAYWEVLDDSIARARTQLGRGGPGAWLNLRVYDVTGRIFDGTNAHSNFDHRIERSDRQWFFPIGRPTSELIVELGLKSDEGYFVKIARSGRVQFPRREPAPESEPEWLTVRVASGHIERAGVGAPGRPGRPGSPPGHQPPPPPVPLGWDAVARLDGVAGHMRRVPWNGAGAIPAGARTEQWEQVNADGMLELHRQIRWESAAMETSWEAGPFPYPVEVPVPVRESFAGKTRVYRVGTQTHVVYGPWQVVIRGLGAEHARTVLSRWEVYRSWGEETGHEVEAFTTSTVSDPAGGSERMVGASGRRWVGSSELRFAGSSEQYFLKASEIRLGGSSERQYAGASEWVARGASERRLGGSSEWVGRGSSERLFAGGSDRWQRPAAVPSLPSSPSAPRVPLAPGVDSAYPPPPSGRKGS